MTTPKTAEEFAADILGDLSTDPVVGSTGWHERSEIVNCTARKVAAAIAQGRQEGREEVERFAAELERLKYDGPRGMWVCDECNFHITVRAINIEKGTIGVLRVQEVPKCLNGCGSMRPLTWKEACSNQDGAATRYNEIIDEREAKIERLREALAAVAVHARSIDSIKCGPIVRIADAALAAKEGE